MPDISVFDPSICSLNLEHNKVQILAEKYFEDLEEKLGSNKEKYNIINYFVLLYLLLRVIVSLFLAE